MIVTVPDGSGRVIEVLTDDPIYAAQRAREWAAENPSIERGAQLAEEDVSAFGSAIVTGKQSLAYRVRWRSACS